MGAPARAALLLACTAGLGGCEAWIAMEAAGVAAQAIGAVLEEHAEQEREDGKPRREPADLREPGP